MMWFGVAAGSSSEKREDLDESIQFTECPSKHLHTHQHTLSFTQRDIQGEERIESRTAELQGPVFRETPGEKREEKAEKLGRVFFFL